MCQWFAIELSNGRQGRILLEVILYLVVLIYEDSDNMPPQSAMYG